LHINIIDCIVYRHIVICQKTIVTIPTKKSVPEKIIETVIPLLKSIIALPKSVIILHLKSVKSKIIVKNSKNVEMAKMERMGEMDLTAKMVKMV
jgi:hypothetical protein